MIPQARQGCPQARQGCPRARQGCPQARQRYPTIILSKIYKYLWDIKQRDLCQEYHLKVRNGINLPVIYYNHEPYNYRYFYYHEGLKLVNDKRIYCKTGNIVSLLSKNY